MGGGGAESYKTGVCVGGGGGQVLPPQKTKSVYFFLVGVGLGGGGGKSVSDPGFFHFVAPPLPLINDRSLTTVSFFLSKTTAYFNGTMQNRVQ